MNYQVIFYQAPSGEKPVGLFLESLRERHGDLHKLVTAGLRKLHDRQLHGPPLTVPLEGTDGVFELRVGGKNIARVFFFFRPNQQIVCTNGYVKKAQKLDPREVARAER